MQIKGAAYKKPKRMNSKRSRAFRVLRNIAVAFMILLVILLAVGVAYTWYMGQHGIKNTPADAKPIKQKVQAKGPTKPSPNAKVGVSVQLLTTSVSPGANASISIKTNPDAKCTITAVYNKVPSKDSGLIPKTADEYGMVSWSWTVENTAPLGKWPVTVTCANSKNSGMVVGDLVVSKQAN